MRFLIVRLGAMGDIVHALPVAAALRQRFPVARIDWLVDARYAALLDLVPAVDRLIVAAVPAQAAAHAGARPARQRREAAEAALFPGGAGWLRLVRALRAEKYEAALDLQGLLKSAVLTRASGARRVIGFARPWLREPSASFFYTERHPAPRGGHVVDKNLSLLAALGIATQARVFPFVQGDLTVVDEVRRRHPAARHGFALLNPGAAWPNKRWPPDRFGALAGILRERHGLASVVLWGPGEEGVAEAVAAASAGAAVAAPRTELPGLLALSRAARLFVSGDTGPLHLAAAAGTRVVGIFGPTDPARNGPWDPADLVVSRYDGCECHYKRRCRRPRSCIEDVTIEDVALAVERRLAT